MRRSVHWFCRWCGQTGRRFVLHSCGWPCIGRTVARTPFRHASSPWQTVWMSVDVANLLETNTDLTNPNDRFGLNTASQPWIQNIAQIERSDSSMLFRDKAMSAKLNLKPETWSHRLRHTQTWHVVSSDLTRPSFGQKGGLAEWASNQLRMSFESAPNEGRISSLWLFLWLFLNSLDRFLLVILNCLSKIP